MGKSKHYPESHGVTCDHSYLVHNDVMLAFNYMGDGARERYDPATAKEDDFPVLVLSCYRYVTRTEETAWELVDYGQTTTMLDARTSVEQQQRALSYLMSRMNYAVAQNKVRTLIGDLSWIELSWVEPTQATTEVRQ